MPLGTIGHKSGIHLLLLRAEILSCVVCLLGQDFSQERTKHLFFHLLTGSVPTAPRTLAGIRLLRHPSITLRAQLRPRQNPNRLTGWHLVPIPLSSCQNTVRFGQILTNILVLMTSCVLSVALVYRSAVGGLLSSSYRQHQESLAAERERRRQEREERLQRIEREERNRFKLVSLY